MLGRRELSTDDYLAILRRKWWVILVPAVLGPALAFGVSLLLPARYTSQSLVLIEEKRVPDSFVQPVVTEDLNARVANMQEQIFSRTRLQPLIERYNLFSKEARQQPMELLVDELRKAISLTPIKPIVRTREGVLPGFYISLTLETSRVAQQVCAEITSMFIEENLRQREQSAKGTTNFLDAQLQEAKRALDEQDAKLAQFKRKYLGNLPDEAAFNLNLLSSLNTQLEVATQSLNRTEQDKTYTESLLSQQLSAWKSTRFVNVDGPHPETTEQELSRMERQLVALQTQYTNDHPDVIRLKAAIAELKKKAGDGAELAKSKPGDKIEKPSSVDPPEIQRLRSQLAAYDEAIKNATRDQNRLQQQIKLYQSRLQMSPVVEQQYKQVTRDHQTALDFYNELLKKKNQSEMATDLEHRQQGEQFRVMDPANLPEKPSFPNRPMFALGGFGGGLALGLVLAYLLEMGDKSLRTEHEIEFYLGLPTFALLPLIGDTENKKKRLWRGRDKKVSVEEEHPVGV